ncbi:MAG: hypothetical protein IJ097_00635 [Bacilli bacterium]|nr:hypothetical protein [Bacilli bacterium]
MDLKIQIISLLFSFLYGIFLFILFRIQYKCFVLKKEKWKIIFNGIYCIVFSLLYFFLLLFINDGTLHFYFLLLISFGFLLTHHLSKKIV